MARQAVSLERRPGGRRGRARGLMVLGLVGLVGLAWWSHRQGAPPPPRSSEAPPPRAAAPDPPPGASEAAVAPPAGPGYLFCFWNVENLFDDVDDPAQSDPEEDGFARRPDLLALKLDRLAEALLRLENGRGPDVIALVEVENARAADLLRAALNARLPQSLQYPHLIHRDLRSGRRFEPALLTRLDVPGRPDGGLVPGLPGPWAAAAPAGPTRRGPRAFGAKRILEAQVSARGRPLTLLISHWTSARTDRDGAKRLAYADALAAACADRLGAEPALDLLLAGDFNTGPDSPAVTEHLRGTGDRARVQSGARPPWLLNLMAGRDPQQFGTYRFQGQWAILDQLVASAGLLDAQGWQVLPETLRVVGDAPLRTGPAGRPFRFGEVASEGPRGYSDHLAVTVRLRLAPPGPDR